MCVSRPHRITVSLITSESVSSQTKQKKNRIEIRRLSFTSGFQHEFLL